MTHSLKGVAAGEVELAKTKARFVGAAMLLTPLVAIAGQVSPLVAVALAFVGCAAVALHTGLFGVPRWSTRWALRARERILSVMLRLDEGTALTSGALRALLASLSKTGRPPDDPVVHEQLVRGGAILSSLKGEFHLDRTFLAEALVSGGPIVFVRYMEILVRAYQVAQLTDECRKVMTKLELDSAAALAPERVEHLNTALESATTKVAEMVRSERAVVAKLRARSQRDRIAA